MTAQVLDFRPSRENAANDGGMRYAWPPDALLPMWKFGGMVMQILSYTNRRGL